MILIAVLAVIAVVLWFLPDLIGQGNRHQAVSERAGSKKEEPAARPEGTDKPGKMAEPDGNDASGKDETTQEQPFLVQITDDDPSIAYVLVRMQNAAGLLPLPLEGEYTRTIRQKMADGSEAVNVLHLTSNGVWMEESNCEGHDCINEGEVTLENREERVLWNMIICLPHQLSLELITREEALQMIGQKK
ncbi:MAG: NusG domain II-containing protein [Clostridia bacterium]|nr:NusG domain II-containing protein [Clostridia bacterium]